MSKNNTIRKSLTKTLVEIAQALTAVKHPGHVIVDTMTNWVEVGEGNILRVVLGAPAYAIFDDDGQNTTIADASATPGLYLATGEHYIVCQSNFIKMSADPTRKELLKI